MKILEITQNDADQRLDKFLKKLFPAASLGLIYKLNRKWKIKISDSPTTFKKQDNEYKLELWQRIKLFISDSDFITFTTKPVDPLWDEKNKAMRPKLKATDIVYEDEDILVLNKNPGINVHPGDHKSSEASVIHIAQDYLGSGLNSLTFKPSLAHRIDRDTSGILLIAKRKQMLTQLTTDFKDHSTIKKTYYAICHGKLSRPSGTINKKLLRIENAQNTSKVQVSEQWLTAITHYQLIAEHSLQTKAWPEIISELEIQIETGRMHQIRVHMAHIWCPILWDKNYGNKSFNSYIAREWWLGRQALHAWKIQFFHQPQNKTKKLEAKIKDDLVDFIKKIK
jgi:23S rRNA pseudouridine955/2504/2580 synthase